MLEYKIVVSPFYFKKQRNGRPNVFGIGSKPELGASVEAVYFIIVCRKKRIIKVEASHKITIIRLVLHKRVKLHKILQFSFNFIPQSFIENILKFKPEKMELI